jgi:outer membrane biosynthesis protein TonB
MIRKQDPDRRATKSGRIPKDPGGSPGRRKALLWILAAFAPVGLGLFLFFGTKSGMLQVFGIPGDQGSSGDVFPRTSHPTPQPAPEPDPEPENMLTPSAPAAPAPAAPAPTVSTPPAPAPQAPRIQERPAPVRPAATAGPAVPATRRAGDKALSDAAKFTRDSLAVFQALARKDSLKAARATRDSLIAVRALARKDSIQQARLLRDLERTQKAEAVAARLAIDRAKSDSLQAIKDAAESETLLRRSVDQALNSNVEEMRGLYNRFALGYPGLKGEVVVSLLVAPNGEIERGFIQKSSTRVKMFDQLVLGNILELKIRPFKSREAKAILVAVNFPID